MADAMADAMADTMADAMVDKIDMGTSVSALPR
jgi:hypothetical protein